jgi:hypothetical protein
MASSLWDAVKDGGSGLASWAAKNPGLVSLLGGALSTAGAASGGAASAPNKSYAPQPGLKMGTLQQPQMTQQPGLLTAMSGPGLANSGLARFGAQGGTYTPGAYNPAIYKWGMQ